MLRNVLPPSAFSDKKDQAMADPVFFSEAPCCHNKRDVPPSYLGHLFVSEFCVAGRNAALSVKPSLLHAVAHVVSVSSCEQMPRVATRWVIAMMAHLMSFWNLVTRIYQGESVRENWIGSLSMCVSSFRVWNKSPIPPSVSVSDPRPALVRAKLFDFLPESNLRRCFNRHSGYVT